jgi:hypothetical protein
VKNLLRAAVVMAAFLLPATAAYAGHLELPAEIRDATVLPPGYQGAGAASDVHSPNMALLGNYGAGLGYREGTDLAFWGNRAIAGSYSTGTDASPGSPALRVFDISDASRPGLLGSLWCPASQNDVSVWRDLVFMSVDSPRKDWTDKDGKPRRAHECGAPSASQADMLAGSEWEGIRIVSIADPGNPQQIAAVRTDCGSHTHTLVPDLANGRVLIYALSYPLNPQGKNCNPATYRKFSIVEVPLSNPTAAKVISTPDVSPADGCHDVSVFLQTDIAAAACLTESQIWDISDRAHPKVIAHIYNPQINIHHSTAFAWDGKKIAIGDELGGAAAAPGCLDPHEPLGLIWFYDITKPTAPVLAGKYHTQENAQQQPDTLFCTAHNFNPVPLRGDRDVMTSAWYRGGTTVFDWTDPKNAKQLGYYIPSSPVHAAAWSSYWYNGLIYVNNYDASYVPSIPQSRGFDVMAITGLRDAVRLPRLNPQTQEPLR